MKRKDLTKHGYTLVHKGSRRGYVSRKAVLGELPAKPYKGRYGEGYTVETPRFDTTQYCDIEYWVKK